MTAPKAARQISTELGRTDPKGTARLAVALAKEEACRYFLDEPPINTIAYRATMEVAERDVPSCPKWSGFLPMPKMNDRVDVRDMGKGPGRVTGFFVEHGWVGMHVELDTPKVINGKPWKIVHVFGIDL